MNAKEAKYHLERTLFFIRNAGKIVKDLESKLDNLSDIRKDYDHEHELASLNAAQMIRLFLDERELFRQRRIILFELESMRAFKKLYDDNNDIKELLQSTLTNMSAIHGRQKNAVYHPRVLSGLRCVGKQYRPMKYFEGEVSQVVQ